MNNLSVVLLGTVTSIWALSTSCATMHNMGMPMNDNMKMMDNSQPDTLGITDPVCETRVDTSTALAFNYEGNTLYFDSEECLNVFQRNPEKFMKGHMNSDEEKSKKGVKGAVMMGGAAMMVMMVIMIPVMLLGVGH